MVKRKNDGPAPGEKNPLTGKKFSDQFFDILATRKRLPCWEVRDDVVDAVKNNQSVVLIGETGSGKTTQVPQFLVDAGYTSKGLIAVTQPRRVAAMSVAARVAQEMDVTLGEQVGYLIRFEDMTSDKTQLKYLTDGMLLRECMSDPLMSKYSVIILDEAHERTLSTDILFGLLKEVLAKRPDLRCMVMSATLEAEKFQSYWDDAPLLRVSGRMFPVETFFSLKPEKDYVEAAVDVCVAIHSHEGPGDVLLFLTGEEEIEYACSEIWARTGDEGEGLDVLPLYSSLPMQQQRKVFPPAKGKRKIIVATNIAETSITIDGVVYVVDPGLFKQKLYNPRTHVDSLLVSPISKASAMQRAGRAGRTRPGKCFRLYTPATFESELPESTHPEIIRSNLCQVVLTLLKLGIQDLVHFDFMEAPTPEAMMRALELLHLLGAIDDEAMLTTVGEHLAELPVDPHLGRFLVAAASRGVTGEALEVVAMLSVPPPFLRPSPRQVGQRKAADRAHRALASGSGDHLSLLSTFRRYTQEGGGKHGGEFCRENFLHERAMKQAESIAKQLQSIARNRGLWKDEGADNSNITLATSLRQSLIEGFFMQCAHMDSSGKSYLTVYDQQMVFVHPSSFLQHKPEWVLYNETVVTDRCYMRNVSAIPPEMLIQVVPKFYHPENCKLGDAAKKSLDRALPRVKKA